MHHKTCAPESAFFYPDFSAVGLDQRGGDGKTETTASLFPVPGFIKPVVPFEDS
jgi:hypothetical protein